MFRFVSFRGRARVLLAAVGAISCTSAICADLMPGYAVGNGSNTASVIIDFAFDAGDAYLFEYRFDGNATAEDMLLALDTAGGLDIDTSVYNFGTGPLLFVNGFTFGGNSSIPDFNTTGSSWVYWLADEPVANPPTWSSPSFGPTERNLSDGSFDGWSVNISQYAPAELGLTPTSDPPTDFSSAKIAQVSSELVVLPIPEPTSAALLAVAGAVVLRRRRA